LLSLEPRHAAAFHIVRKLLEFRFGGDAAPFAAG
jgi:hypothetical protein